MKIGIILLYVKTSVSAKLSISSNEGPLGSPFDVIVFKHERYNKVDKTSNSKMNPISSSDSKGA